MKLFYFHSGHTSTQAVYLAFTSEDDVYGWMDALQKSTPTTYGRPYAMEHQVSVKVTENGYSGVPPQWEAAHSRSPSSLSTIRSLSSSPSPIKRPGTQESVRTLVSEPSLASLRSTSPAAKPSQLQKSHSASSNSSSSSTPYDTKRPTDIPERSMTSSPLVNLSRSGTVTTSSERPGTAPTARLLPLGPSGPSRSLPHIAPVPRSASSPVPAPTSIYFVPDDNDEIHYLPNPYGSELGHESTVPSNTSHGKLEPNRLQNWPSARFSVDSIDQEKMLAQKTQKLSKSRSQFNLSRGNSGSADGGHGYGVGTGGGFEKDKFFEGYSDGTFGQSDVGFVDGYSMKAEKNKVDVGIVVCEGKFKVNEGGSWMGWMWPTKNLVLTTKLLMFVKGGKSNQKSTSKIPLTSISSIHRVDVKPFCLALEISSGPKNATHQNGLGQKSKTLMIVFDGDKDLYDWYDAIYTRLSSSGQGSDDGHGVGRPKNFVHRVHVGFDPYTGQYSGIPDQWKRLLRGTQLGYMIDAGDSRASAPRSNKSCSNLPRAAALSEFNHSNSFGSSHSQPGHTSSSSAAINRLTITRGFDYDRYGIAVSPPTSERATPMPGYIQRQQSFSPEQRRRKVQSRMETLPSFSSTTSTVVG
ncbi:hypothetical protein BDN72DRAFT_338149 [Pluteus cervinus]|uniref:Uncharacterized protein n=1 Tax=Pluteus cervinus TaxID=181527 RepID=A0ACD3ABM7_9AGAR|nr:hypothetical protein BDN72DRAFT_338149 [Pluteus cervinus]